MIADNNFATTIPEEMLECLPVKMNFKEHFTLKLLKQRYKKKFGTTQYLYDVKVDNLPYHLDNASSILALSELFEAIMDACSFYRTIECASNSIVGILICAVFTFPPESSRISTSTL